MAPEAHEIHLELRLDEDSLSGRASDPHGAAREFVGWVGLVAAIEALLGDGAPGRSRDGEAD